ncbi:MAG: helix-turn-helix domain-containing protein [Thermanaeromonas sp.]|uniref:helix-turn-helix domain-containing protein n=1 Tax=Thermanaeromonas sp. TaxID=2003697 RepID=UPI002440AB91|nr:helix-turn-helix transcriptional regulator [Thermanaeromonas sp.]MCG0278491.1 helix-turn-helix domain-containing protein [Thermanaeromonas sp.]
METLGKFNPIDETVSENELLQDTSHNEGHTDEEPNYYRYLGQKIRAARNEAGLTQAELASYLGITPTALNYYEAGKRQVPIHILETIALILGKPIHYFLGPDVEIETITRNTILNALSKLTDAIYLPCYWEIDRNGRFNSLDFPPPIIPFPKEIAQDAQFAVREKAVGDKFRYYLCKYYKGQPRRKFPFLPLGRPTIVYKPPSEEALVIAEESEPEDMLKTGKYDPQWRICHFKDVVPYRHASQGEDPRLKNLVAIIVAKVEPLPE